MDIPLNADVYGSDGRIGRSTYIIVNPVSQEVTHIVVRDSSSHHTEHMIPVKHIQDSDSDMIRLDCTGEQVSAMEPFQEVEFIPAEVPILDSKAAIGSTYIWPYITARQETHFTKVVHRNFPPYERDIRRGAHVHASDGHIGQINELIIDKDTLHLTHLVLREGHLWGKKDVIIPVDAIETIEENDIYLKLDKRRIEALPAIPVHHHVQH